jgi:ABC-type transport system substrate-binding protein
MRLCGQILLLALVLLGAEPARAQADARKVLRYAFEVAETSMDPQKVSDVYSNIINSAIFDAPLRYDYLARPVKLIPNTLAAMPEISADYRTYTLRIRPGIFFDNHEAFGGKKRELTAEDYVYSIKRLMDPKMAAPLLAEIEGYIVGSDELLKQVRQKNRMDFDTSIEGLKTLDRYTLQIRLVDSKPNWIYNLADCRVSCAVAREVAEKYGDDIGSHPVGTNAYRLASWKRSSKLVFEPNPNFREEYFHGEPAENDTAGQAILAKMKGRRLPMIGRIEVSIIEERQPRWLAFLGNEHDLLWLMPEDFANVGVPNNQLAPNLRKQQIQFEQVAALDLTYAYFNMNDPLIGGYTPDKVALRRAISLGYKTEDEIKIIRKGQAVPAHTPYSPGVMGYETGFRTSANEYNPAKAKALLDMYGYVDRDGDGFRETPDGKPLVLKHATTPTERDKQFDELWKRSMDDIGLRIEIRKAKWPDLLKESNAGKLMMWQLGGSASSPDAGGTLQTLYGPNCGYKGNRACFKSKEYDEAYEAAEKLPHGPERTKLYQKMAKLMVSYAPWKINTHRIITDMWYPYIVAFRRPLVQTQSWWKFVDIDLDKQKSWLAGR